MRLPAFTKAAEARPRPRPVPANLYIRTETGKIEVSHLPPGARTSLAMEPARPAYGAHADTLGELKSAHAQCLRDLKAARLSGRKTEIHDLEKAERRARRSIEVFARRFSKGLLRGIGPEK